MNYGLILFPTEYSISPTELAIEAEGRGFSGLLFPEHTHIPSSRDTPYPGGGELPKEYAYTYDPFVALSFAAAATSTLEIGTGIALVTERDPITLAKEVASLDRLSGGRFLFGIGAGWNIEEMSNHGTAPGTRWRLLEERLEAMKTIWSQEEASFSGKYVNFSEIWQWPKPLRQPHPPVLLGGNGPTAIDRAARIADEWLPIPGRQDADFGKLLTELEHRCNVHGREPIPVSLYGAEPKREKLAYFSDLGVKTAYFWLPSEPRDEILQRLDKLQLQLPV